MRKLFLFLIMTFLFLHVLPVIAEENSYQTSIIRTYEDKQVGFSTAQKNIQYPDKGYFFVRKIHFYETGGLYTTSYTLPGSTATVSWFDENGKLVQQTLKTGNLPMNSLLYLETKAYSMIIGQNFIYRDIGDSTIQNISTGRMAVQVKQQEDKWLITCQFPKTAGCDGILWGVGSQKQLLDLSTPLNKAVWPAYDVVNKARIGWDGYYFQSPTNYRPIAPQSYWRIPSNYLANCFMRTEGSEASRLMGNAMLVLAAENLNEQGFFPTLPICTWLKNEYNIGNNFFDDRFNVDAAMTYLIAYQKFGNPLYRDIYRRIADYFMAYAETHHFDVSNHRGEAWLLQDYGGGIGSKSSLCALNHQLAVLDFFLVAYEQEGDIGYKLLAEKLLMGIQNTKNQWIKPDGNLHYAYLPSGKMGMADYPYLTYNDLFNVQKTLMRVYGERDADLDELMLKKKEWMDRNLVTDYYR